MKESGTRPGDPLSDGRLRLAVVGDIHLFWTPRDSEWFASAGYDRVLIVGDLGDYSQRGVLRVARLIGRLGPNALVFPGNHDGVALPALIGELLGALPLVRLGTVGQERRVESLRRACSPAVLCGYSTHRVSREGFSLSIIAARPHAMGGRLSFAPYMERTCRVRTLADSARRLAELVDRAPDEHLVFFAHNGPAGLGDAPDSIWGCDFRRGGGDWGDPDLAYAIDYARAAGRRVLAVVAGHMHHRLRTGGWRRWHERRDGTLYINAARVPRIFRADGRLVGHHVELELTPEGARAREVLVPQDPPSSGRTEPGVGDGVSSGNRR